jgi:hypothetical protein
MKFEAIMEHAIEFAHRNPSISKSAISRKFPVARKTLSDRLNGRRSRREFSMSRQRLNAQQEEELIRWILDWRSHGIGVSHQMVAFMVHEILDKSGDNSPLGKNWVQRFVRRHEEVRNAISRPISIDRFLAMEDERIQQYFDRYEELTTRHSIAIQNIWNMDEKGFSIGQIQNGTIITAADDTNAFEAMPGNRDWVSIIECISMEGGHIDPMVIFKGIQPTDSFQEHPNPTWQYAFSPNGWTNKALALVWLQKLFIPSTKPSEEGIPRLLILDGHKSHISDEFLFECLENRIFTLFLPPSTSHLTQPLDIGCFGPVAHYYTKELQKLTLQQPGACPKPVSKGDFLQIYERACLEGFKKRNIRGSWRGAGLRPFNPSKVLKDFKYPVPLPQTPTRRIADIDSISPSLDKSPHNLHHLQKHQDYILDAIEPLSQLQNSVSGVFRMTSRLLVENARLQDEVSGIKRSIGQENDDSQRRRLKIGEDHCITGDDILEQRRIKKAKSDKLINNYSGLDMEDFLYEFNIDDLNV